MRDYLAGLEHPADAFDPPLAALVAEWAAKQGRAVALILAAYYA